MASQADSPVETASPPGAGGSRPRARRPRRRRGPDISVERVLLAVSIIAAILGILVIAYSGREFYTAPAIERIYSDERAIFGTTGTLGLFCGAAALTLFLSNFGYLLRKHIRILDRVGTLRLWLDWHVTSAFLGGAFVALHANFAMRNWIARTCVYAVVVVTLTGLVGRYLLRFVPRSATGRHLDEAGFTDQIMELIDQVRDDVLHDPAAVKAMQGLVDELGDDMAPPSLGHLRQRLRDCRRFVAVIAHAMADHVPAERRREARILRARLAHFGRQAAVVHWASRIMDAWRAFHRAFALLLLVGMLVHVIISLYYGYGAFWR